MSVQERVDRGESVGQQRDPRGRAGQGCCDHCQRGQATAQRVQADDGRVSQVRVLAGSGAVML